MTYTFWHRGILIGESPLHAQSPEDFRHRTGDFYPTKRGLKVLRRLTGMLSASYAVQAHLDSNGLYADDLDLEKRDALFSTFPAGRRLIEIELAISDLEVRSSDGTLLKFESIAFTDAREIKSLAQRFAYSGARSPTPSDARRPIVSITFASRPPDEARQILFPPFQPEAAN
jgi:hypothetical protein